MQLGTALAAHHCPRCGSSLKLPVVYRDNSWYHTHCWQEGEHLLANAERIARALNPTLFIHETVIPE
jgi:hypothetical protein